MKTFVRDQLIMWFIVITPFLFFTYKFFPKKYSIEVFNYTIHSGYYELINVLVWSVFNNLLIIILFSIWFITSKFWWRYIILISIVFEIEKVLKIFYDIHYLDVNLLVLFIVALVFVGLLILISNKLNFYSNFSKINNKLNSEIDFLTENTTRFNGKDYKKYKAKISELKMKRMSYHKKDYLKELIKLREEFNVNSRKS